jgi:hypothetical protein
MDQAYKEALKRVEVKKKFFKEISGYVATSLLLIFINVFTSPAYLWCLWAIVPWGIVLVMKGIKIGFSSKTSQWEQKALREELIAMGKNPDDYLDDYLELEDIEKEEFRIPSDKGYRNSDLV